MWFVFVKKRASGETVFLRSGSSVQQKRARAREGPFLFLILICQKSEKQKLPSVKQRLIDGLEGLLVEAPSYLKALHQALMN